MLFKSKIFKSFLILLIFTVLLSGCSFFEYESSYTDEVSYELKSNNHLQVSSSDLKEIENPIGIGGLVYVDYKETFDYSKIYVVWIVENGMVYPLNGNAKQLTPDSDFLINENKEKYEQTNIDKLESPIITTLFDKILMSKKDERKKFAENFKEKLSKINTAQKTKDKVKSKSSETGITEKEYEKLLDKWSKQTIKIVNKAINLSNQYYSNQINETEYIQKLNNFSQFKSDDHFKEILNNINEVDAPKKYKENEYFWMAISDLDYIFYDYYGPNNYKAKTYRTENKLEEIISFLTKSYSLSNVESINKLKEKIIHLKNVL